VNLTATHLDVEAVDGHLVAESANQVLGDERG
jgi:hypothetical protein